MKNCPNCAAPYDAELNKCPYCGTSYFDLSAIDFESGEPIYLKVKTNMFVNGKNRPVYITQMVIPRLNEIEVSTDTTDVYDRGRVVKRIVSNRHCSTNVTFDAVHYDGGLFKVEVAE